jgi:hypothetical protein
VAERRMFAKTIIDSDAFLDMPLSAQALYFHLAMRADDDGFINNPKKIMRVVGANQNDYDLLIAKKFVLVFENGVIVIKHWRIHNYIRSDRYKPTIYQDERKMLELKNNGAYTWKNDIPELTEDNLPVGIPDDIPDGYQMETQDRLGKDSIGKDIDNIISNPPERDPIPYQQIIDLYNSICTSYPRVTKLSDARKKAIKARLKTYSLDDFKRLFEMAEASDFLKGKNDRNWSANFDWLIKDSNMAKVLDGNYTNSGAKPKQTNKFNQFPQRTYTAQDYAELERKLINKGL